MYAAIAEIIIENEKNDYRFENFTRELCGKHEGLAFVPTAQSWDQGRDARSTAPGRGTHRNLICATLNKDLTAKVDADLLQVTSTSAPDRLIYCSSQRLSEHKIDEIEKTLRRHIHKGSILTLGSIQLGALAEKYTSVFERYYQGEIQAIRSTILESPGDESSSTRGLRLALLAFGSDEAASLRHSLLHQMILDFLAEGKSHTAQEIVDQFSKDLGLPKAVRPDLVAQELVKAQQAGTTQRRGDGWSITAKGQEELSSAPAKAAENLLEGRQLIRDRLEALVGNGISESQFEQVWAGLIDFLAGLFHANGLAVIRAVDQFLTGSPDPPEDEPNLRALLFDGISRTTSVIVTNELRETVGTAILDLLTERSGGAFEWLTRIAERYVSLCSLGLESSSGEEIRKVISSLQVVIDSDVILDFLCDGEVDHRKAQELLTRWVRIGGRLLVSTVVLEEVAYHAWISQRDFAETENLLGKLQKFELPRYIKSAFVRTYHVLEKNPKRWDLYIGQFRGNSKKDFSKILRSLRQKLKVETLPENYLERLREDITTYLMQCGQDAHKEAEELEDIGYKVERDGRLMASIAAARTSHERAGTEGTIVLLSSSHTLRRAENYFREQFGEARVLLSINALSYLLSTVPEAALGVDSLRRALFEFGRAAKLKDTERRALRVIRATEEYDVPWADRVQLETSLTATIRREAEKRGIREERVRSQFMSGTEPIMSAEIIAESLKAMAISNKTSEELSAANRKIEHLQNTILGLEVALKSTKKTPPVNRTQEPSS